MRIVLGLLVLVATAWADVVTSGSSTVNGVTVSFKATGQTSSNSSTSSSDGTWTLKLRVDGTPHEVRVVKDMVEAAGQKVAIKDAKKIEVQVVGQTLTISVDGKQVIPQK